MKKLYTTPRITFDSTSVAALPRDKQVLFRLTQPKPPEGAHVTGPWGWGFTELTAEVILRQRYAAILLRTPGLTPNEIAQRLAMSWLYGSQA